MVPEAVPVVLVVAAVQAPVAMAQVLEVEAAAQARQAPGKSAL